MPIGLDLGTGLTRIARHTDDDEFRTVSVPTAVLYRGLEGEIPPFSSGVEEPAAGTRCDGFPMLLGGTRQGQIPEWGSRTPIEAAQAFLRLLLSRGRSADGDLVVAVSATPGKLGEILSAIGEPPRRMVPAPAAAVAYLRHARPDLAAATRFIVCDLGAGSVSIALCAAGPRATVVIDHIDLLGAAAWSDDTEPLASNDGRPDTLTEKLVSALAMTQGATLGRSVYRWRGLEAALRQSGGDWPRALTDGVSGPWSATRVPVLRFADLELTAGEFLGACAPLAHRAGSALRTLLKRQPDRGWRDVPGPVGIRMVLLGGLSVLWPVKESLLRAAGLDPRAPGPALVDLDTASRLEAAARGAALLAAGKAGARESYPHLLRLPVHRLIRGEARVEYIPLAAAGTIDYEQPERLLLDAVGEPYLVMVRQGRTPLPIEIVPNGTGTPMPAVLAPSTSPEPGRYRIAVGGGPDGVTVALHRADGPGDHRYTLIGFADSSGAAGAGWLAGGTTP
jgi:hypothetical protein